MPDIMPTGDEPALSATSDMPAIAPEKPAAPTQATETPHPADPAAPPAAESQGEGKEGEAATPVAEKTEPHAEPAKPKKEGISERFSEITAQRRAAEQRADRLTESLEKALGTIEKLTAERAQPAEPVKSAVAEDPRPKREGFDDPDTYDAALVEWSARQATRVARAEAEKEALERRQADEKAAVDAKVAEENARLQKEWTDRRSKAIEEFPDYAEVAEREDLQISMPMAHAILNAENGPAVAYHLGKNPQEAARIAALNPVQQVFEMGRIAAELARPKPNVSKAPDPIQPLGSKASAAPKTLDEMSMEEFAAHRQAQINAQRRRA